MTEYRVPTGFGTAEFTEKRSRFIGHVWPVESEMEAREKVAGIKTKYHDARHNCWSCIIREGGILRYSDDGEPQGTAGQPMLDVFQREKIENVCCVVTRYFGGVLLGTGGLVRAYAHTAKIALNAAGISVVRMWKRVDIPCTYSMLERIKNELAAFDGRIEDIIYGADVMIHALLPELQLEPFLLRLTDMCAGQIQGTVNGEAFMAVPLE